MDNEAIEVKREGYDQGNLYIGETKDDKKHGKGVYIWAKKGWMYDGSWDSNLRHGIAITYFSSTQDCIKSIYCYGV